MSNSNRRSRGNRIPSEDLDALFEIHQDDSLSPAEKSLRARAVIDKSEVLRAFRNPRSPDAGDTLQRLAARTGFTLTPP